MKLHKKRCNAAIINANLCNITLKLFLLAVLPEQKKRKKLFNRKLRIFVELATEKQKQIPRIFIIFLLRELHKIVKNDQPKEEAT
jgi:hypothetical protein